MPTSQRLGVPARTPKNADSALVGISVGISTEASRARALINIALTCENDCRAGGIRTHDPLTPSQVRYQAALQPATSDAYVIASPLAPFALGPDPHVNANRAALESELLAEPPLDESAVTCL